MTRPGYNSVSLTDKDREALHDIWERTLKPLGINYSSAAMIRHLIKHYEQTRPRGK